MSKKDVLVKKYVVRLDGNEREHLDGSSGKERMPPDGR